MSFKLLYDIISQMTPVEVLLTTLIVGYLAVKGIIAVPKWLKINKGKEPVIEITDSVHTTCPNYPNFLSIINKHMFQLEKIIQIKYIDTVYEQMNEAEISSDKVKDILRENFKRLLLLKDPSEEQKVVALKMYKLIIDGALKEALGFVRRWVKKNHLVEKSDVEYQQYIRDRMEGIFQKVTCYIDDHYMPGEMLVDREELHTSVMQLCYPVLNQIISDMFIRIRAIAESKAMEIKILQEGFLNKEDI